MKPIQGGQSYSSSMWNTSVGLALVLLCLLGGKDLHGSSTWSIGTAECSPSSNSAAHDGHRLGYVYWRNATKRTQGSVVPLPKQIKFAHEEPAYHLTINPGTFEISSSQEVSSCVIVNLAQARYLRHYLFDDRAPELKDLDTKAAGGRSLGQLKSLTLLASGTNPFKCQSIPQAQMDESYELIIRESSSSLSSAAIGGDAATAAEATLSAPTCWGILRGLETFSQLVFNLRVADQQQSGSKTKGRGSGRVVRRGGSMGVDDVDDEEQSTKAERVFAIRPVEIQDEPRFSHRGLMLDTARHYISLETILDLLDAMAFNKLNVFHWHLVDDQSFPFESHTYPELSRQSAYRPEMIYSHEDVQLVIVYAAMRGIRVMPELDTPGHTYALRHIPNLLSDCYDPKSKEANGDFGPIDPTRLTAYKAVNRLLDEFKAVFPEKFFHAGGDEVDFDCWKSNPNINKWMSSRNISGNYEELSNYYLRRLYNLIHDHDRTMLVWQEVFDMGASLPNDTIIHVWKNINDPRNFMRELERVVSSGYRALLSSCWYLNYIDYGQDWVKFYQCDPTAAPIKQEQKHLVLGGEICMWTEFVDDTNVVSRIWPRASAAAERLWSPAETTNNVDRFLHRLEQHRCRLTYRGIRAEPVNGPGYC